MDFERFATVNCFAEFDADYDAYLKRLEMLNESDSSKHVWRDGGDDWSGRRSHASEGDVWPTRAANAGPDAT